jgi:hypothetical protein
MDKLEKKKSFHSEKKNSIASTPSKNENRSRLFSNFSMESETDSQNEMSKPLQELVSKILFPSPLQSLITKFCNNSINNYVFHTKLYLEYDDENAFIFIFKNSLVFTHLFDEKSNVTENPIIYIVKYQQV